MQVDALHGGKKDPKGKTEPPPPELRKAPSVNQVGELRKLARARAQLAREERAPLHELEVVHRRREVRGPAAARGPAVLFREGRRRHRAERFRVRWGGEIGRGRARDGKNPAQVISLESRSKP